MSHSCYGCFAFTLVILVIFPFTNSNVAHAHDTAPSTVKSYTQAKGCTYLDTQAEGATFVLYIPSRNSRVVCNPDRAEQPVLPASTFKIAHALIALETEVVKDEDKKEASDGKERMVSAWNQPTSLASGMTNSTVWFYQRIAQRVGSQRERYWLKHLDYGNADMGADTELTTFWLTGALRITALEQVQFVDQLRQKKLPASIANQDRVAKMMIQDLSPPASDASWILHVKSGAVLPIGKNGDIEKGGAAKRMLEGLDQVGWYTGWVERPKESDGDAVFALHLPMHTQNALAKRRELTLFMLAANEVDLGITK